MPTYFYAIHFITGNIPNDLEVDIEGIKHFHRILLELKYLRLNLKSFLS